jgi:hypothetical protein
MKSISLIILFALLACANSVEIDNGEKKSEKEGQMEIYRAGDVG